jgi:hypothetical protein
MMWRGPQRRRGPHGAALFVRVRGDEMRRDLVRRQRRLQRYGQEQGGAAVRLYVTFGVIAKCYC